MTETPLTKEQILDTAEQVFRRFGPDKATVVDVAKSLKVSHGTVYRHFASKAELKEAVVERWLHRVSEPLARSHKNFNNSIEHLKFWLDTLIHTKRKKMLEDPELFTVYAILCEEAGDVIHNHINELISQITKIIEEGIANKEFRQVDSIAMAKGVFFATARFHHPILAKEWTSPEIDMDLECVWELIVSGIKSK